VDQSSVFDGSALARIGLARLWIDELARLCPGDRIGSIAEMLMLMELRRIRDAVER
jgi:hypothetical protein